MTGGVPLAEPRRTREPLPAVRQTAFEAWLEAGRDDEQDASNKGM